MVMAPPGIAHAQIYLVLKEFSKLHHCMGFLGANSHILATMKQVVNFIHNMVTYQEDSLT